MAVAVAVSHGPADSHVVAVIAFLLALIFGHTVIVLLDDLMGQVLEMRRFKGHTARIGVIAQDVRRHRILAGHRIDTDRVLEGIGKGEVQAVIGDGRVHADRHVSCRSEMRFPAGNEQTGPQCGIEQSRADLADTAAGGLFQFILEIRRRRLIALVRRPRADILIEREILLSHDDGVVQALLGQADVDIAVGIGIVKMRRIVRQDRVDILEVIGLDVRPFPAVYGNVQGIRLARMQFIGHGVLQLTRIDDDAVLGVFDGNSLLVILDIGIGILRVLIVLVVDIGQDLIQFIVVDGNGQRHILAMAERRHHIGHALPGQAPAADEMQFIVDIGPVQFSPQFIEIQRHIDTVRRQAQLLIFYILFMEIQIIGNIIGRHIGNGLAVEGHHLFRLALGRKKAAEPNHTQSDNHSRPLLPGRPFLFRRQPVLFPVPPAIFLHPFFPCSFFVSHILTCLYSLYSFYSSRGIKMPLRRGRPYLQYRQIRGPISSGDAIPRRIWSWSVKIWQIQLSNSSIFQ